jgi:hypothetical protein
LAATVDIYTWHDAPGSPTKTLITALNERFTADDSYTAAGTGNPLLIPAAGSNYSYWRSMRLKCSVTPAGSITNLKFYTAGVNPWPAGITLLGQLANVAPNSGYRQATGTAGVSGDALAQSALTITAASAAANIATFTVANTFSVNDIVVVAGMTPAGYNGTWTVASASSTQFTANIGSTPGAGSVFGTATKLNHTGLTTVPVNPFTWTSLAPLALAGSIVNPATGDFGDFVIVQAVIASTLASAATQAQSTITWQYDEV